MPRFGRGPPSHTNSSRISMVSASPPVSISATSEHSNWTSLSPNQAQHRRRSSESLRQEQACPSELDRTGLSSTPSDQPAPPGIVYKDEQGRLIPPPQPHHDGFATSEASGATTATTSLPSPYESSTPPNSQRTVPGSPPSPSRRQRLTYIDTQLAQQPRGYIPRSEKIINAWDNLTRYRRSRRCDTQTSATSSHPSFIEGTRNNEVARLSSVYDRLYGVRPYLPIASQFPTMDHGPLRSQSDSSCLTRQRRSSSMPSLYQLPLPTSHLPRKNSFPFTTTADTHSMRASIADPSEEPSRSAEHRKESFSAADNLSLHLPYAGSTHDTSRSRIRRKPLPPTVDSQSVWSRFASEECDRAFFPDRNPLNQDSSDSTRSLRDEGP